MGVIVDKYNIADENVRRCLQELEDKISASNSGTVKYYPKTVTESDLNSMKDGDIIIEETNSRIVAKVKGKLRTATLSEL